MNKIYLTQEETSFLYYLLNTELLDLDSQISMEGFTLKQVSRDDYNGFIEPYSVQNILDRLYSDKSLILDLLEKLNNFN